MRLRSVNPYALGSGIGATVVLVLELAALVAPRLDTPPPLLTVPVVIAAYFGALRAGLACAAWLLLYAVLVWMGLGYGDGSDESTPRLFALGLGLPLVAVIVGLLREKADRRYRALVKSESELRDALAMRDRILAQSMDVICTVNREGKFVLVSAASEAVWGYRPDELIGRQYIDLVHPGDRDRTLATAQQILSGNHTLNFINRYIRKDGSVRHVMWSSRWCEQDQLMYAVARDYTEQKEIDEERARYVAIIEATTDLVGMTWSDGRLSYMNRAGRELLGLDPDEDLGAIRIEDLFEDWSADLLKGKAAEAALEKGVWTGESSIRPRSGEPVPVSQIVLAHRKPEGGIEFMSTIARNIATIKALEARLREEASTDELTGLFNRRHFMERFRAAAHSALRRGHPLSFAICDVDGFKAINDQYGHAAGDNAIRAVANVLREEARGEDLVGRFGGDEFCVLFEHASAEQAAKALDRFRTRVAALRLSSADQIFTVTLTVGVAQLAAGDAGVETVMEAADRALYLAKAAGRNQVRVACQVVT